VGRRYFATELVRLEADRGFSILPAMSSGGGSDT
jgi:hypothetical protein